MRAERHALVPLNRGPIDLDEWQADARLPLLRGVKDQIVERLADLVVLAVERV